MACARCQIMRARTHATHGACTLRACGALMGVVDCSRLPTLGRTRDNGCPPAPRCVPPRDNTNHKLSGTQGTTPCGHRSQPLRWLGRCLNTNALDVGSIRFLSSIWLWHGELHTEPDPRRAWHNCGSPNCKGSVPSAAAAHGQHCTAYGYTYWAPCAQSGYVGAAVGALIVEAR